MLSYQRTGAWQAKQCDGGFTIDMPAGRRTMHTLAKLPKSAPSQKAKRTAPQP
jgi:hypothetical protein